jgi:hypothetical protein
MLAQPPPRPGHQLIELPDVLHARPAGCHQLRQRLHRGDDQQASRGRAPGDHRGQHVRERPHRAVPAGQLNPPVQVIVILGGRQRQQFQHRLHGGRELLAGDHLLDLVQHLRNGGHLLTGAAHLHGGVSITIVHAAASRAAATRSRGRFFSFSLSAARVARDPRGARPRVARRPVQNQL